MLDLLLFTALTSYLIGYGSRPNIERLLRHVIPASKPLRRVPVTFTASTPAVIEPAHRWGLWKLNTHAFIFHGEHCQRQLSQREMYARTGLTPPMQREYLTVLERAGIVQVVKRRGAVWMVGKGERRARLVSLPYPTSYDPPAFATLTQAQSTHSDTGTGRDTA